MVKTNELADYYAQVLNEANELFLTASRLEEVEDAIADLSQVDLDQPHSTHINIEGTLITVSLPVRYFLVMLWEAHHELSNFLKVDYSRRKGGSNAS